MIVRRLRALLVAVPIALMIGVGLTGPVAASAPVTGATCGADTTTVTWSATVIVGPPFVSELRRVVLRRVNVLWLNELGTSDPAGTIKQVDLTVHGAGSYPTATPPGAVLLGIWYFDRLGNFIGNSSFACG